MKQPNSKSPFSKFLLAVCLVLTFSVASSSATETTEGGNGAGNGGTFIMIGNKLLIADPFAVSPEEMKLSEDAVKYLSEAKQLLGNYGVISEKFWNLVFSRTTEYLYREELPCTDLVDVEGGGELYQYGCTKNGITYIKRSIFERAPFRQQMLAIIHERLHAFHAVTPDGHHIITQFIAGVDQLLNLLEEQNSGSRRALTDDEIAKLQRMYRRAEQLGFSTLDCVIAKSGGACADKKSTFENSFAGIGSVIEDSRLKNSTVIASRVRLADLEDSEVLRSEVNFDFNLLRNPIRIRKSKIEDSSIEGILTSSWPIGVGRTGAPEGHVMKIEGSILTSAKIRNSEIITSTLTNTYLRQSIVSGSTVSDSRLESTKIEGSAVSGTNFYPVEWYSSAFPMRILKDSTLERCSSTESAKESSKTIAITSSKCTDSHFNLTTNLTLTRCETQRVKLKSKTALDNFLRSVTCEDSKLIDWDAVVYPQGGYYGNRPLHLVVKNETFDFKATGPFTVFLRRKSSGFTSKPVIWTYTNADEFAKDLIRPIKME